MTAPRPIVPNPIPPTQPRPGTPGPQPGPPGPTRPPGRAWVSSITPTLTYDEARTLTDKIVKRLDGTVPFIKEAFERRADKVLGYPNWNAYCDAELRGVRVPLRDQPSAVAELREAGMSVRAIGSALSMPKSSVADTMAELSERGQLPEPERIKSLDGRERPATMPARQEIADEIVAAIDERVSTSSGQDLPPTAAEPMSRSARRETITHARLIAKTVAANLLTAVNDLVAGSHAGAPEVITPELVAALRSAVDVLEAEMLGRELDAS